MRRLVEQRELGAEHGDAARGLYLRQMRFECVKLKCIMRKLLELHRLFFAHGRVVGYCGST